MTPKAKPLCAIGERFARIDSSLTVQSNSSFGSQRTDAIVLNTVIYTVNIIVIIVDLGLGLIAMLPTVCQPLSLISQLKIPTRTKLDGH